MGEEDTMKIYKRMSLLLTMGIMWIGILTFSFSPAPTSAGSEDSPKSQVADPVSDSTPDEAVASTTPSPTLAPTPTEAPNVLTEVKLDSLNNLIKNYLNAKLTCDRSSFEGIVSDTSLIDEDVLQARSATILAYKDIKCYYKRGYGIIDYVIYYTYFMDIATIDSPAMSIDSVYVTTNDAGSYVIFLGALDDATEAKLKKLSSEDDVLELVSATYEEVEKEIESDENLLAYWMRLYYEEEGLEDISGEDTEDALPEATSEDITATP